MSRVTLLLICVTSLVSCHPNYDRTEKYNLFGVEVELTVSTSNRQLTKRAIDAVAYDLKLLDEFTSVQKSKPLSRVNSLLQNGEWFSVNPSLFELILLSHEYFKKTEGAFNPVALGAMRQAWGFKQTTPSPDLKKLNQLLKQDLSMNDVEIKGIRVRGSKSEMQLDFDLLAIGYAIDNQLEHMHELGITNATLGIGPIMGNIGTGTHSLSIKGHRNLSLRPGESICRLSSDNNRFANFGRIDPRSAWPVKPTPSIVVIDASARTASVACAALSIISEDEWDTLIQNLELRLVWWQRGDQTRMTPAFRARLQGDSE